MINARSDHSMIYNEKYIYAIGGENSNLVERYNIENNTWEILPNMLYKRMYPILYVYDGYLYSFFGKNNNEYPYSIERLNIHKKMGNDILFWEKIEFINLKNIDLRYYGCAVYEKMGFCIF